VAIYLGIDGGGTKTTCVVADETSVLGSATTGGSNITRHGDARVREALRSAVKTACAAAKVDPSQIESACVGLSGAGRPEVRDAVAGMMRELLRARIVVLSDLETTLQAAFGDSLGVITIAGTGSIAYGRDAQGQTARAGGWGLAISDEGSGQWIGRTAVSAVLGAKDAGDDPPLLATILNLWKFTSLDELVRRANASPPPDFSSLFRVVLAAAEAGDPLAEHVLYQAGTELAAIAGNVIRRLFADGCSVQVAMSGGVFRQSEMVRQVFYNKLTAEFPQASIHPTVVEPVRGALELARKAMTGNV
jgi:N-acetylglucosamine kinase-like BadF-type ATPase